MTFLKFATVVLDDRLNKPLDYGIPKEFESIVQVGTRVLVPLRNEKLKGTVLFIRSKSAFEKVQPILDLLLDQKALPDDLFKLGEWMSRYYATPMRKVLSALLPASVRKEPDGKVQQYVKPVLSHPKLIEYTALLRGKKSAQAKVLDVVLEHPKGLFLSDLIKLCKTSESPIKTLIKEKVLSLEEVTIDRSLLLNEEFFPVHPKVLNEEQQIAFTKIKNSIHSNAFSTHLIFGVTGSGKTEVYLQAIKEALALDKSTILLVPEVALTSQTIERLKSRFQERMAVLHYRLSDGERMDAWKGIHEGKIKIIVGARSAIFSPAQNLGLIIVDEEQEGSFKQSEEMPCYHARDIAIVRGKLCHATVVLGSATPALETFYNATQNKYHLHTLTKKAEAVKLPDVTIVDMTREREKKPGVLLSDLLLTKIEKRLRLGEQTILFLNRRGYYRTLTCSQCNYAIKCPHCDQSLTFHKKEDLLSCHLCGYELSPPPTTCEHCHKPDTLKFHGPGTEHVERALHAIFKNVRTLRMDADTTRKKGSHEEFFKQFKSGKADVLIGTQMVAKGLHFPQVTLVGVLNADSSLNIPDFRSTEHVFQLITQVSGRSGRGELPGEVVIQTTLTDHPIIHLASKEDYKKFFEGELESRKLFDYPPFTHLIKIILSSEDEKEGFEAGKFARDFLIQHLPDSFTLTPVVPCGIAKVQDKYKFQFMIKGTHILKASDALIKLQENPQKLKKVHMLIDVDPISTFS
jgi:primosomal protein N' (replication factor Y)